MDSVNSLALVFKSSYQTVPATTGELNTASTEKPNPATISSSDKPSVVLSQEGKAMSGQQQNKYADIDATKLPDTIKRYLKAIRDLQEQIAKKMEELERVMKDQSLSEKDRDAKVKEIRVAIAVLTSTLSSITSDMIQEEAALRLKQPDRQLAASLMLPK